MGKNFTHIKFFDNCYILKSYYLLKLKTIHFHILFPTVNNNPPVSVPVVNQKSLSQNLPSSSILFLLPLIVL